MVPSGRLRGGLWAWDCVSSSVDKINMTSMLENPSPLRKGSAERILSMQEP